MFVFLQIPIQAALTVYSEGDGGVPVVVGSEASVKAERRHAFEPVPVGPNPPGGFRFLPNIAARKIAFSLEELEVPFDGCCRQGRHDASQVVMPPGSHGEGCVVGNIATIVRFDVHGRTD